MTSQEAGNVAAGVSDAPCQMAEVLPEPTITTKRRYISVNVKYLDTIWVEPNVVVHANKIDHNGRSRWAVWKLGTPRWEPQPGETIDAEDPSAVIDPDAAASADDAAAVSNALPPAPRDADEADNTRRRVRRRHC